MTTIMSDSMSNIPVPEPQQPVVKHNALNEAEFVKCDCCSLIEECTQQYISKVRERHNGRWICGLCGEAIKDEIIRSQRLITTEEAMNLHMNFCKKFKSPPIDDPTVHLITAMRHILRKSLEFPRGLKSAPNSPTRLDCDATTVSTLARSESCFPALSNSFDDFDQKSLNI